MPRPTETLDIKGVTTHNNMLALDGSKKLFCPGCGGPRDVAFAETHPCGCCGSLGTQKVQPLFDEHGERLPDDEVAKLRAAQAVVRAKKAAPAPVEQPVKPKAAPKAAKPVSKPAAKQAAAPKPAPQKPATKGARKQQAARSLAALFG